jgi:hypothetical protein
LNRKLFSTKNSYELTSLIRLLSYDFSHTNKTMSCSCGKKCASFSECYEKNVTSISSWADQAEAHNEFYAERRRAAKNKARLSGYKPQVQQRCSGKKPICDKCTITINENSCHNADCTFLHSASERQQNIESLRSGKQRIPICDKCVIVITGSRCCNPKCTFRHGQFDKREYVRCAE